MRPCYLLIAAAVYSGAALSQQNSPQQSATAPQELARAEQVFVIKPYLQLGDAPTLSAQESLVLMWHAADVESAWRVRLKRGDSADWEDAATPRSRRVAVAGIEPHRVYEAKLARLKPGAFFDYQVLRDDKAVFSARGRARRADSEPQRFVVFGDCAADTPEQRVIAFQAFLSEPDFVFIPGDIVYSNGRISEYRAKFYPVYNSDEPALDKGAPFIRSTLFVAAPGNHDTATRNFSRFPDLLAYFLYWSQPLNGPLATLGAKNSPLLEGVEENQSAFLAAAGGSYPRMANFSFGYGNAHWTVLDSNRYVDWTDRELRQWLKKDLEAAKGAQWRFVGFHHPGFNSSKTHFKDQWMRVLADVFEAGGVDIVFAGHVHNYQRSYPMRFATKASEDSTLVGVEGQVDGEWKLDTNFDGERKTKPDGVIYIVSGGGGARLYTPEQQSDPASWQPFTTTFISEQHTFTVVDIDGGKLTLRQLGDGGREVDKIVITK